MVGLVTNEVTPPSLGVAQDKFLVIQDNSLDSLGLRCGTIGVVRTGPVGEGRVAAVRTPDGSLIARILKYKAGALALYPINPQYRVRYYLPSEAIVVGAVVDIKKPDPIPGFGSLLLPRANAPVFRWGCNQDGELQKIPHEWTLATGLPEEALRGWGFLQNSIHPEHQGRAGRAWKDAITNGHFFQIACSVRSAFGRYVNVATLATPVVTGNLVEWSGLCQIIL